MTINWLLQMNYKYSKISSLVMLECYARSTMIEGLWLSIFSWKYLEILLISLTLTALSLFLKLK